MSNINIPLPIIIDILCRQPGKSLLRFRCLSKIFRSLIDSPDFVKLHLIASNRRKLILTGMPDDHIFSLDCDSTDNDSVHLENPFKGCGCETKTGILGSCNGLIALQSNENYVIWNPSTKKRNILPKCSIGPKYAGCPFLSGFGYVAASDDYKLVQVISTERFDVLRTDVFLYSLKTNSWKTIKNFPFSFQYLADPGALIGSTLNWMATEDTECDSVDDYKQFILAFDLTTEQLVSLPEPDNIISDVLYRKNLGVLEGCLSMANRVNGRFDIWLMKEYALKESWTKLFSFMPFDITCIKSSINWLRTVTYAKSGKEVLLMLANIFTGSYSFRWYNLEEQKGAGKCFRIHIEPQTRPRIVDCSDGYAGPLREIIYLESLVSPHGCTSVSKAASSTGGGSTI